MHFFKSSIKSKLWVSIVLLVIVMLFSIWIFQVCFLKSFYIRERIADLKEEGKKTINFMYQENKLAFSAETLSYYFANTNYPRTITIIDNNKAIVDILYTHEQMARDPSKNQNFHKIWDRYSQWIEEDPALRARINERKDFVLIAHDHFRPSTVVGFPIFLKLPQ